MEWRCFHCDEVFTERHEAFAHFGSSESEAACVLQRDRPLLVSLREMEERNHELLRRAQQAEDEAESYAGHRAELKRYFGSTDAWTCWNRMDEVKGELLAARETIAELLALGATRATLR